MSILINKDSRVLVQAITGKSGSLQTKVMLEAGTNIVAAMEIPRPVPQIATPRSTSPSATAFPIFSPYFG